MLESMAKRRNMPVRRGGAGGTVRRLAGWHLWRVGASGLLWSLCYPQMGWWLLSLVALLPAGVAAARSASIRTLLWVSYLVGLVWWLAMLSWLIPVTGPGYVGLSIYLALYLPLSLLVFRYLHRGLGVAAVLSLPMAWVSMELIRSHIVAGGFSWFLLGHALAPFRPEQGAGRLMQVADFAGEWGVSFLAAMVSGLGVDLWTAGSVRRAIGPWRWRRRTVAAVVIAAVCLGGSWGYGQFRLMQAQAWAGPRLRVAVVQTNVPQNNKINRTDAQDAADWVRVVELTHQAALAEPKPDLIVWPETTVPRPINAESRAVARQLGLDWGDYFAQLATLAEENHLDLLIGTPARTSWHAVDDGKGWAFEATERYNSALLIRGRGTADGVLPGAGVPGSPGVPGGTLPGGLLLGGEEERYDKVHRVPFGEYMPWIESAPWLKDWFLHYLSPYDFDYSIQAGKRTTVFPLAAAGANRARIRMATPICFEDVVGRDCRQMVYGQGGGKRADLLVNLTNDGWYSGYGQRPQHFQIAVFRCVENRVPMVRSVNAGVSGLIDSSGKVQWVVENQGRRQLVDGFAAGDVVTDKRQSVYGLVGDGPAWGLAVVTGLLAIWGAVRHDGRRERVAITRSKV
ncbi:MAG: apolipoprotein N-acyltransferase [Phycisphaeraceae bacterium]|nr:apolipoprotein N-acyltransferase [Phycisphaeraceae bacterium]